VAGRHQRAQVHEARTTLDGVERAENCVQRFLVVGVTFEAQQVLFDVDGQVHGLDNELLEHIVH